MERWQERGRSDRGESGKMRDKSERWREEKKGVIVKLKKTERLGVEEAGVRGGQWYAEVQTGEGMIGAIEDDVRWDEATCESVSLSSEEGETGEEGTRGEVWKQHGESSSNKPL